MADAPTPDSDMLEEFLAEQMLAGFKRREEAGAWRYVHGTGTKKQLPQRTAEVVSLEEWRRVRKVP